MIIPIEELKQRARGGDSQALQTLRDGGYFASAGVGYPASHTQRRLWLVDRVAGGGAAYHIPMVLRLDGALDAAALRGALQTVVRRHESLRTAFAVAEGELRQFVHDALDVPWQAVDIADDPDRDASARQIAHEHAVQRFDLTRGPLLRAALLRLSPLRHLLLLNIHHIAGDLVSLGVLVRELSVHYQALAAGQSPASPPLPVQYKDFAVWQNALLAGAEAQPHRRYWLAQLADPPPPLDLPADFVRPPLKTYNGRVWQTRFDAALTERISQCGLACGATPFMVLTAALTALLHRYSGQDDIVVGFPLAGRDHPSLTGLIGCFINTVALRNRIDPEEPFAALLARVRLTMLDAYEHQIYPFDRLIEELKLPRDASRSPLFDVLVSFAHAEPAALHPGGIGIAPVDNGFAAAKVDLSFDFAERDDGLALTIVYCTDLYAEPRIRRLAENFVQLLTRAVASPETAVGAEGSIELPGCPARQVKPRGQRTDRRALPSVDPVRGGLVAPRDDLEAALAGFFAHALHVEAVGAEDDFFDLGGDSLLAMRIVSRLEDTFHADVSIAHLFRAGHVRALAEVVRAALPPGRADAVAAALCRLQAMSPADKQVLRERTRQASTASNNDPR
jgi:acyl carrier protein